MSQTENSSTRCVGNDGNDSNKMMVAKSDVTKWRLQSDVLSCARIDGYRESIVSASTESEHDSDKKVSVVSMTY